MRHPKAAVADGSYRAPGRAHLAPLVVAFLAMLLPRITLAGTCTSIASGNWSNSAIWSCGGGPGNNDDVVIASGHTVTLNVNSRNLDSVTVQSNAVLQGNGSATLFVGRQAGEDISNNGTINFSGANAATLALNRNSQWGGSGVWNLTTIDLSFQTLGFTAGTTTTINLSGAGNPITNPGALNSPSTITWNYNGTAAQTLSASTNVAYGNISINNAAGVSLASNLTPTSTLTPNVLGNIVVQTGVFNDAGFSIQGAAGKTFSVANGATFNITNASGMVTGFSTRSFGATSTVNYALNGNQPVSAETYGHLSLSGGGTKTPAAGTTTIQGNFSLAAGVTYAGTTNNPTVNLAGSFLNGGTFNSGTGVFTFDGTTAQTLTGATTFSRMALNNSAGLTINNDVTVTNQLTLTSGVLTTGANTVNATTTNCASSVVRTSGYVAGFLRKHIPAGGSVSCTFEVGDATTYLPINTTFTSVSAAGDLTGFAGQLGADHPDTTSVISGVNPAKSVNAYWGFLSPSLAFASYSATFNYTAGNIDAGAATGSFIVGWGQSCSGSGASRTCSAWSAPTVGARNATNTQATGLTSFGDFVVGEAQPAIHHFAITVGAASASTCFAKSITITAQDILNNTVVGYVGTVNISTSSNHGDWSQAPATGTLVNGSADDGAAGYTFVAADSGVITLSLVNHHADDLTIGVVDSTLPATASTSSALNFRDNAFVITSDTIQIAGRDQSMSVAMWRRDGANCAIATSYTGAKNLDAWLTRDGLDPGGAAAKIGGISLPSVAPAVSASSNNVSLTFTNGVASFGLSTSDVGKYVLNLRDDTRTYATGADIAGSTSSAITTRPWLHVAVSGNPGANTASGTVFTSAGTGFAATVRGVLWQAADDADNDGVPDTGANLADNAVAPGYAWATTLSAVAPYTPAAGTLGTLTNGSVAQASFSGGSANVSNLQYSEVGSFTVQATATNYLNSTMTVSNASGIVGRFTPAYFNTAVTHGCPPATFTYSAQRFAVTVTPYSATGGTIDNYRSSYGFAKDVTISDAGNAANFSNNVLSGVSAFTGTNGSTNTITYTFPVKDTAPAALTLRATDTDNVSSSGHTEQQTEVRSGRVFIPNAFGSELVDLAVPMVVQYYRSDTDGFVTNTADNCTAGVALAFSSYQGNLASGETCVQDSGVPGSSGQGCATAGPLAERFRQSPAAGFNGNFNLYLKAPGGGNDGSVVIGTNLAALSWLRYDWDGNGVPDNDPSGRVTFGVYRGNPRHIYLRERY
ncbi:MAG: DUF6701 domain-containing protein [Sulfurifustaceae bacterium]